MEAKRSLEELEKRYNELVMEENYLIGDIKKCEEAISKKEREIEELKKRVSREQDAKSFRSQEKELLFSEIRAKINEPYRERFEDLRSHRGAECVAICFGISIFATDDDLVYREYCEGDSVGEIAIFDYTEVLYCFETLSDMQRERIWDHIESSPDTPEWFSRDNWGASELTDCSYDLYTQKNVFGLADLKFAKRDCEIDINLEPLDIGLLNVEFVTSQDSIGYTIENHLATGFSDFVQALYCLFKEFEGHYETDVTSYKYAERGVCGRETEFEWDSDRLEITVKMIREYPIDCEARDLVGRLKDDIIMIYFYHNGEFFYKISVNSADLCYATARACTNSIKKYGILGYKYCMDGDEIKLDQLIFLKAFALGRFDSRVLVDFKGNLRKTLFDKEMDMLFLDI